MIESEVISARLAANRKKVEKLEKLLVDTVFEPSDMPPCLSMELVELTPGRAQELLETNIYEYQRDMKSPRVVELVTKIKDGRFVTAVVALARYDGDEMLCNGQHVLQSCVLAGIPIKVVLAEYDCEAASQLACLWNQFDTGGVRTLRQMAASYVVAVGTEWTTESVALFSTAFSMMIHGVSNYKHFDITKEERLQHISENLGIANRGRNIVFPDGEKAPILARSPVVAAVLQSLREDPTKAATFWEMVSTGLGAELTKDHPAYTIREYLLHTTTSVSTSNTKRGGKNTQSPQLMNEKCLRAWKAYRRGETITKLIPSRRPHRKSNRKPSK